MLAFVYGNPDILELSTLHENAICPFQGLLILKNVNMTL